MAAGTESTGAAVYPPLITTQSVLVGTAPVFQFPATLQLVVEPFHVTQVIVCIENSVSFSVAFSFPPVSFT